MQRPGGRNELDAFEEWTDTCVGVSDPEERGRGWVWRCGRAWSCECMGQGKSLAFIVTVEGEGGYGTATEGSKHRSDMVWFTVSDLTGCAAENGVRGPRAEAGGSGGGIERLLQAKGGGGLDDGAGNEGRETLLSSGYFDSTGLDVGGWKRRNS